MSYRDKVSGVTLLTGSKDDTGWIAPTLQNGWQQYGVGWDCMFRRMSGIVYIRGLLAKSTAMSLATIFTLPTGFRPAYNNIFGITAASQTVPAGVYVVPSGELTPTGIVSGSWSTLWTSFSGIQFPAEL